jgi:hypothetical protein
VLIKTGKEAQEAKDLEHTKALGRLASGGVKRDRKEDPIAEAEPDEKRKRAE